MIERMLDNLIAASYRYSIASVGKVLTPDEIQVLKLQVVEARKRIADHVWALEHPPMSFSDLKAEHRKEFE